MSDETHMFTIDQLGRGKYDVFVEDAAPDLVDELANQAWLTMKHHDQDITGLEVTVKIFR